MTWKSLLGLAGVAGVSMVVGCGGNVVVDGPGGVGGGGAGGSTVTTPTGDTLTTAPSTVPTDVDPAAYCDWFCDQLEASGCLLGIPPGQCDGTCAQLFKAVGDCKPQLKAYYDCAVAAFPSGCDIDDDCEQAFALLDECVSGPCKEYGCPLGGDGYCSCEGFCEGSYLVTDCESSADGYLSCYCLQDGQLVGTCDQEQSTCSILESCCTSIFLGSD